MSDSDNLPAKTKPMSRRLAQRKKDQRLKYWRRQILALDPQHLDPRRFKLLVASGARATLLLDDAYEFLRQHGLIGEDGELRRSVTVVQQLLMTQLKILRELGLTPAAMGKLRNERPIDLAAAFTESDGNEAE